MDLSLFLSSFSAFLYKTAAMSEQYFNQNEPKAHFKKTSRPVDPSGNSDVTI